MQGFEHIIVTASLNLQSLSAAHILNLNHQIRMHWSVIYYILYSFF